MRVAEFWYPPPRFKQATSRCTPRCQSSWINRPSSCCMCSARIRFPQPQLIICRWRPHPNRVVLVAAAAAAVARFRMRRLAMREWLRLHCLPMAKRITRLQASQSSQRKRIKANTLSYSQQWNSNMPACCIRNRSSNSAMLRASQDRDWQYSRIKRLSMKQALSMRRDKAVLRTMESAKDCTSIPCKSAQRAVQAKRAMVAQACPIPTVTMESRSKHACISCRSRDTCLIICRIRLRTFTK